MNLITLKTFDKAVDAHLLKSYLESEGIPSYIFDENTITMHPLFSAGLGGIKLKVNDFDHEPALEIINRIEGTPLTDEDNEIINCPNCGSPDLYSGFTSMKGFTGAISMVISFLMGVLPIYQKTVYRCRKCGSEFKE